MERFERTQRLFGKENMDILSGAHILVVGVGGVGGYATEMIARCGVGKLTIVDFDTVSVSNINRQIIALSSTVGKPKVEVLKERIFEINPNCTVVAINQKFDESLAKEIFSQKFDFVVDAIDDLENKLLLVKIAKEKGIKIVSAMGAGNRVGIPTFEVCDVFKTHSDGLAKKFRKMLKDGGVSSLDVVFSKEKPILNKAENEKIVIGSTSYSPAMCGCVISAFVINKLINLT